MEPANGTTLSKITTIAATNVATTASIAVANVSSSAAANASNTLLLLASGNSSALPSNSSLKQQQQQQIGQLDPKQEEANNLSLASSEGQRSISGAPSASSSPILSPSGKIFGRNANGTIITTSRPGNEAEIQLYRVLQRASLLTYYDTLLEMGGDDVQQLYEAGEEEFLEIMALVGMASKPLHVRRLQKALHEWANNPAVFQGPVVSNVPGLYETPTKTTSLLIPETLPGSSRTKQPVASHSFNPTPLINTMQIISTHSVPQLTVPSVSNIALPQASAFQSLSTAVSSLVPSASASQTPPQHAPMGVTHQVTSSSPQLTPVLTELQVARITLGAEKIALQLPQREPRTQTSKKRTSRELEQVIAMSEHDPRRMDEIRKYSAIYGRFDCKRRPEKPLTLHEVCVNEAAAQLCRLVPALLTRRDELFPLARQIVKDAGFGHSASVARYGGILPQMQGQSQLQRSGVAAVDCESSDTSPLTPKRARLSSTDTASPQDCNRESLDDSRFNLFAMYQRFAKPPFELLDMAKFPLGKSERDDNDDSRFSYGNSSSSSLAHEASDQEREFVDSGIEHVTESAMKSPAGQTAHPPQTNLQNCSIDHQTSAPVPAQSGSRDALAITSASLGEVQVISAAGSHIIAVANPALVLSPTLNDALSIKREISSTDL